MTVFLLFSRLFGKVHDGIDRAFLRKRWGPLQELLRFTAETRDTTNLDTLTMSVLQLVGRAMGNKAVVLLLMSRNDEATWSSVSLGTSAKISGLPNSESPWLQRLAREDRAYLAEEMFTWPEWQHLPGVVRSQIRDLDIQVFLPLRLRVEMIGLLMLGPKTSGRGYAPGELDLLEALALHAAATMARARLHRELGILLGELEETRAQLVQSGKLAAVGTLAAGIAHEVNNPLFAISGMAELMLSSPGLHLRSQLATDYVTVILEMSERIAKVVQDMLGFARNDAVAIPVCLNQIADNTLRLMEHKLRSGGINVVREYFSDLPPTPAVANQLQQALMNLIINAGDAMGESGTLTLVTGVSGGRVWVSCIDTGGGISEEAADHIFEAFFTTKAAGQGTGLGLYLTRRIVENFGGEIKFDRRKGVGTKFTIYLPICSKDADDPVLDGLAESGHGPASRGQSMQPAGHPTGGFGPEFRRSP